MSPPEFYWRVNEEVGSRVQPVETSEGLTDYADANDAVAFARKVGENTRSVFVSLYRRVHDKDSGAYLSEWLVDMGPDGVVFASANDNH